MLAGNYDSMDHRTRKHLNRCRLVCRDWVPRCRLHLLNEISVNSRPSLESLAKFLLASPFHAERVTVLKISGEGPDQTWISTVPLRLPPLPHLAHLVLRAVDFSQQPPHVYQVYSLLRSRSLSTAFRVVIDEHNLITEPHRIAILVSVLRLPNVYVQDKDSYPLHTLADVALVKACLRRLSSCMRFHTRGNLQNVLKVLHIWMRLRAQWVITTTRPMIGLGESSHERLWMGISSVFALPTIARPHACIEFCAEGLGKFIVRSVEGAFSTCILCTLVSLFHRSQHLGVRYVRRAR